MPDSQKLYQSYRQSLRELKCILGVWLAFAAWNVGVGALTAFTLPEPDEGIATVFGMPKWVFFTVLFPWLIGNVVIVWFAIFFMRDTPEEGDES